VRDVADVVSGIKHAIKEGWCDPTRVVLMGGSAGGLTVLNAAASLKTSAAAVVALFPVTDLLELNTTTHRFESGYNTRLLGALPGARATYVENSATTKVDKITAPVLLLHGAADKVVVPAQSAALAAMLERTGTPVERHVYDGEGHGWRRAGTVADEIQRTMTFLTRYGLA